MRATITVSGIGEFTAEFAGVRTPSSGEWRRFRSSGRHPAIMGCRLFARDLAVPGYDGVIDCALTINNGTLEGDLTFQGPVYFDGIRVDEDEGYYRIVHVPRNGESVRWIDGPPPPAGDEAEDRISSMVIPATYQVYGIASGPGFFPARAQLTRRFLLVRGGNSSQDGRLRRAWLSGAYDDQPPAELAHPQAGVIQGRMDALLLALDGAAPRVSYDGSDASGQPAWAPHRGPWLGWGNLINGGEQGGTDIALCPDWTGTAFGGRYAGLVGDLIGERNRFACYLEDGRFATRAELGLNWPYDLYRGAENAIPQFKNDRVVGEPNGCTYEAALRAQQDIDLAHLIRAYGHDLAATRLVGDNAARHRLLGTAEDMRLGLSEERLSSGSSYEYPSLEYDLRLAQTNPNKGGQILRSKGWANKLGALVLEYTAAECWGKWADMALQEAELVRLPSDLSTCDWKAGGLNQGDPWYVYGLREDQAVSTTWQAPFYLEGLARLDEFGDVWREGGVEMARALYANGLQTVPGEDNATLRGNPLYAIVAENGAYLESADKGVALSRPYYDRHALALVAVTYTERRWQRYWFDRMRHYGQPAASLHEVLFQLEHGDPEQCAYAWRMLRDHLLGPALSPASERGGEAGL